MLQKNNVVLEKKRGMLMTTRKKSVEIPRNVVKTNAGTNVNVRIVRSVMRATKVTNMLPQQRKLKKHLNNSQIIFQFITIVMLCS